MQRSSRFLAAVGSGYAVVVTSSLLSLISIPVALNYLGREGLGVAATILLINSFGQVLQLGVGPSIARFVVDCVREADQQRLASLLKLGVVVGSAQGVVLSVIALTNVRWLSVLFNVPLQFTDQFQSTLSASLLAVAFGFLFVPIHQLLYASQRIDLINYIAVGSQVLSTVVLLVCLYLDVQIHSYAIATWVQVVMAALLAVYFSKRLGLLPCVVTSPTDWRTLPALARFAGNVMAASLGLQLIAIAPALVINRLLGAAAMGDWTVGTKLIQLGTQLTARIPNAAEPTLWEIFSRGEKAQCSLRLRHTAQIATTIGVLTGAVILSANGNFVSLWSKGRVTWALANDFMGAAIIIFSALAATWCMLPGITKRLGRMKYIYPVEGMLILGLLCVPYVVTGLAAVLLGMLISLIVCRLSYGVCRAMSDLDESLTTLLNALRGPLIFAAMALPTATLIRIALCGNTSWLVLLACAIASTSLYVGIAYVVALPRDLKDQMRQVFLKHISNSHNI